MRIKAKALSLVIHGLIIFLISLLISLFVLNQKYSYPRYEGARLVFQTTDNNLQREFAVQQDTGKFLFAAGAPNTVGTSLLFKSTEDIIARVKPLYDKNNCSNKSLEETFIIFASPVGEIKQKLTNEILEFKLSVLTGDRIPINLENSVKSQCGKAIVWLEKEVHTQRYLIVFLLAWLSLTIFLSRYNLEFLGVWGAVIHGSFFLSELIYFGPQQGQIGFSMLVAISGLALVLVPLASKMFKLVSGLVLILLTPALLFTPWLNIVNFFRFESPLDGDSIHAILQSNFSEVIQFLGSSFSILFVIITGLLILIILVYICFAYKKVVTSTLLAALGLFLISTSIYFYPTLKQQLVTFSIWSRYSGTYFRELQAYEKLTTQRNITSKNYQLARTGKPKTTVLVIGESHNKNHMSIYGYPRNTTPNLNALLTNDQLVVFKNAYSNHTHTNPTLTLALTHANQYGSKNWINSPSIIDIAKQNSISTYWISNQQLLSAWDNQVALIAKGAKNLITLNKKIGLYRQPNNYDESLLPPLKKSINDHLSDKLIIVHLFGSHATYCFRYPRDKTIYDQNLETNVFGRLAQLTNKDKLNCYDNSVAYNDLVLGKIFELFKSYPSAASVFYVADHSEDVITGKAHNQANFIYSMAEIPTLFWANEKWKTENRHLWDQLNHNKNELFTNDLVFETVIGIMGLQGEEIDRKHDLSSDNYVAPSTALSLHRRVNITSKNNVKYWQSKNISELVQQGLDKRVIPHRVNTIGKMSNIVNDGILSFEVDVLFQGNSESPHFEVGHDKNSLAGMTLKSYLEFIPEDFGKIWLDIKNVTANNIENISSRLDELDSLYKIKDRTIIETSDISSAPKLLSDKGYHLSYYLPTGQILSVWEQTDEIKIKLAKQLVEIVKQQNVGAVSFDLKLYRFVKDILEPLIESDIQYHTWFPGITYSDPEFIKKLHSLPYFSDNRVKTILVPYSSFFSL